MGVQLSGRRFIHYYLPAIVYGAGIFVLSSIPALAPPQVGFELSDKFYHFLEFLGFGFLLVRAFANSGSSLLTSRATLSAGAVGTLYALSDEFHQHFVPNRKMEFWDFVADTVGIILICLLWWAWNKLAKKRPVDN